jgi:hypothetical protein
MTKPKYSIIAGNLMRQYNGAISCTGLHVYSVAETIDEVKAQLTKLFEQTDLIIVIDLETGCTFDMRYNRDGSSNIQQGAKHDN